MNDDKPAPTVGRGATRRLSVLFRLYRWATYRLYNELAWAYDAVAWLVSAGQWSRWRKMALDYATGPRVLEVGFGTGELLLEMARRGMTACGLELSPAMQRIAAAKMRRLRLAAPRVRGKAQRIPVRDGVFDTILSTFPADYILDPQSLREFARVLRPGVEPQPGGRLVVVGLTVVANRPWLRRLLPVFYGPASDQLAARWQQLIAAAGLKGTLITRRDGLVTLPIMIAERIA